MAENQPNNLDLKLSEEFPKTCVNSDEHDSSLLGLLEIITDVNKRLQNVDNAKKKVQLQKAAMNKEMQRQQEQISSLFQENCSLNEKVARLDIDKKNATRENVELRKENEKLNRYLQEMKEKQKKCSDSNSINSSPLSSGHKIESGDSLWNSKSLEKQMSDVPKTLNSGSSSVLLDGEDYTDELVLEKMDLCLKDMTEFKKDLTFVNYSLKYFLHRYCLYSSKIKGGYYTNRTSFLVSRGGGEPDSLEEPVPAANKEKWPTLIEMEGSIENPLTPKRTFQKNEKKESEEMLQSFFKRRQLPWPSYSDEAINRPTYYRGISTEAQASSLPSSCSILSPDSLASYKDDDDDLSVLLKEERICPICQRVFPENIPQKDFVDHAQSHFDFEEYELVN